jgi:hypothetical protein
MEPPPAQPAIAQAAADHAGLALPTDRGQFFTGSGLCTACHTQMTDGTGRDVSTDTFWRASMMANAARDPYWQATVRAEVLTNPDLQAVIEEKCATCHMPMAHTTTSLAGGQSYVLDTGFSSTAHDLHPLAMDGISCTLCHQIRQDNLGTEDSFSGGYTIDGQRPMGEREAFGRFRTGREMVQLMQSTSGFVPVQGVHTGTSEMCAVCHTLYTPFLDATGEIAGEFPEQTPYLEWLASGFGNKTGCQVCHMPAATGAVRLSATGGPPREPTSQHIFVGGNAYMLSMLERFGPDMEATASSAQFRDKQAQALDQLQTRTASLQIASTSLNDGLLTVDLSVASMTGHKFPTGFPSRRAWLHLTVQDAAADLLFESGAVNPDGSITGNDNDLDSATYEPHYLAIDSPDQVQIYESIMGDTEDQVTTTLLRGAGYLKDNRLLPAGFDKATAADSIAVHGSAADDPDFLGATDKIQYQIDVGDAQGPFTVEAELLYQAIGFRWATNLQTHDAPEPARFIGYYGLTPNQPTVIAAAAAGIE